MTGEISFSEEDLPGNNKRMNNSIDDKLNKRTRKKNHSIRNYLLIGLAGLTIGYATGRVQEAKDHFVYQTKIERQIMKAHDEGYKFAKDADPSFFKNTAVLYKDPKTKTMTGVMLNREGKVVGPIRNGGRVGFKWYEQLKQDGQEFYNDLKEKAGKAMDDLSKKIRDTYNNMMKKDTIMNKQETKKQ